MFPSVWILFYLRSETKAIQTPPGNTINYHFYLSAEELISSVASQQQVLHITSTLWTLLPFTTPYCSWLLAELKILIKINVYNKTGKLELKISLPVFALKLVISGQQQHDLICCGREQIGLYAFYLNCHEFCMDSFIFYFVVWAHYLLLRTPSLCFLQLWRTQGDAELQKQLQAWSRELGRGIHSRTTRKGETVYVLLVPYLHSCQRIHIKCSLV